MTWFKIDDSFYDHPKVFDAPDSAVALWVRAGTWSARNLTDGFVPAKMPARLCDDPDTAVRELTNRGLWLRAKGGYQFHDWPDYQPTREGVESLRAKRAEAGRKGGLAKQNGSKSEASASHVAKQNSAPARPDPEGGYLGEGELRESTRAEQHPPPPSSPAERPPERCPKHRDDERPPPCGACADHRRAAETWDTDDAQRRARVTDQLEQARRDRRLECDHGTPAGLWTRPDTGESPCPMCRRQEAS